MSRSKLPLVVSGLFLLGALCVQAFSQDATAGGNGGGRQRGQRGDPTQMRQQMMDRMKADMGASDDEWKVIQPKLEKVMTLSRETRGGGMGMGGNRRGGRGGDNASRPARTEEPQTDVGKAAAALSKVLENKDAKPEDIKPALQALRDARAKAKTDLEAAQKDLRDILTLREEAVLVERGILD